MPTIAEILLVLVPIFGFCTWVYILFGGPDYEEYLNDFFKEWVENFYPIITGLFMLAVVLPWFGIVALIHWLWSDAYVQYASVVGLVLTKFPDFARGGWHAYALFPPLFLFSIWVSTTIPLLISKWLKQYRDHRKPSVI